MPVFAYGAVDQENGSVSGTITADSPRQARDKLRGQGLRVRAISDCTASSGKRALPFLRSSVSTAQMAAILRELATLIAVGIPVLESLETLIRQYRGRTRHALMLVRDRISAGCSLAEAMTEQPQVFDALCVQMVEVGENSGSLDYALEQLAAFKERSLELKDQVLSAILYPAIVFGVSLLVSIFLMTVVVPMLLTNLVEAGRELPWPTRMLKHVSDLLLHQGWIVVLGAVLVVAIVVSVLSTRTGRKAWHRFLLRIPLLGTMAEKQAISRIALVISTLIRSGVEYLKAVEFAGRSTRNLVYRDALTESSSAVSAGVDIGNAVEATGVFPPTVVHILTVGQQSGTLDDMLERLSQNYDRQVSSSSSRLASALEPILILVLAVFVGFILFATLLPILEASNVL